MILNIITIIVVAIVLIIFSYFEIFGFYQKKYYESAYKPTMIKFREVLKYPEKFMIEGITNVSNDKQYQEASAVKMITDVVYPEKKLSIEHINFLMGYTYGTSYNIVNKNFIPFSEPIEGLRVSAPFMGLHMDYYTTYSVKLFVDAVKYYISTGYPVLVQLDMSNLYNKKGFYPHSELLVGYDKKGFYFYETIGKQNESKKYVKIEKLSAATNKLNKTFKKPWKYGFCVFKTMEKDEQIDKIIKRNGDSLIGGCTKQTASGSQAIEEFAKTIASTKTFNSEWVLEALAYSRQDNSMLLKETFKDNSDLIKAAELFEKASKNYSEALAVVKLKKDQEAINKVCELLLESSQIEKEIGNIFTNASK